MSFTSEVYLARNLRLHMPLNAECPLSATLFVRLARSLLTTLKAPSRITVLEFVFQNPLCGRSSFCVDVTTDWAQEFTEQRSVCVYMFKSEFSNIHDWSTPLEDGENVIELNPALWRQKGRQRTRHRCATKTGVYQNQTVLGKQLLDDLCQSA